MTRRILIFTGEGKGKTTAAIGMAVRACGHGVRVKVIQFIKKDERTGELAMLQELPGMEIVQAGMGFVPSPDHPKYPLHQEAAQAGLALATETLQSGKYALVVLDEILGAVGLGLLEEAEVVAAIKAAASETHIALTGRDATEGLIALADTVTEMRCIKHAYEQDIPATKGIEF